MLDLSLGIWIQVLNKKWMENLMLFVNSIRQLYDQFTKEDLISIHSSLILFVKNWGTYFPSLSYSINLHSLFHLCLYAERWGPLYEYTTFSYERAMGLIARNLHGSSHYLEQIGTHLQVLQMFSFLETQHDLFV
jgi:hypothetical protein